MKPGYKTSEFYVAIFAAVGAIAVAFGVLTQVETDTATAAIGQLASAVIALEAALQPVIAYIKGRAAIKEAVELS